MQLAKAFTDKINALDILGRKTKKDLITRIEEMER